MKKLYLRSRWFWWRSKVKNRLHMIWVEFRAIYIHRVPRKEIKKWKKTIKHTMSDPEIQEEIRKISRTIVQHNKERLNNEAE